LEQVGLEIDEFFGGPKTDVLRPHFDLCYQEESGNYWRYQSEIAFVLCSSPNWEKSWTLWDVKCF